MERTDSNMENGAPEGNHLGSGGSSPPLSRAGSSASTIYFEFQRNFKVADENSPEDGLQPTTLDRILANWVTLAVLLFLMIITLVCSLIPVKGV